MNIRALVGRKRATHPGEGRPRKLTPEQEERLREWAAKRKTLRQVAADLGIGLTTARNYIRGTHIRRYG